MFPAALAGFMLTKQPKNVNYMVLFHYFTFKVARRGGEFVNSAASLWCGISQIQPTMLSFYKKKFFQLRLLIMQFDNKLTFS